MLNIITLVPSPPDRRPTPTSFPPLPLSFLSCNPPPPPLQPSSTLPYPLPTTPNSISLPLCENPSSRLLSLFPPRNHPNHPRPPSRSTNVTMMNKSRCEPTYSCCFNSHVNSLFFSNLHPQLAQDPSRYLSPRRFFLSLTSGALRGHRSVCPRRHQLPSESSSRRGATTPYQLS